VKNAHHNHLVTCEYDDNGKLVKDNYDAAAQCSFCNLRITENQHYIPVIAHNARKYDIHFLLPYMSGDTFTNLKILSKSEGNMFSVSLKLKAHVDAANIANAAAKTTKDRQLKTAYGIKFIDLINFMNESLDNLAKTLVSSDHKFSMLKGTLHKLGYNSETVKLSLKKKILPLRICKKLRNLERNPNSFRCKPCLIQCIRT